METNFCPPLWLNLQQSEAAQGLQPWGGELNLKDWD